MPAMPSTLEDNKVDEFLEEAIGAAGRRVGLLVWCESEERVCGTGDSIRHRARHIACNALNLSDNELDEFLEEASGAAGGRKGLVC